MGLFVSDVVLWLLGVRGQFDEIRPASATPLDWPNMMRVLAAMVAGLALLFLAIWATVGLTIALL